MAIVKCNATGCEFNYKGICEQRVIDLDMYGQCQEYCEKSKNNETITPYVSISQNCNSCQHRVYGLSHPYCELHGIFINESDNSACPFHKAVLRGNRENIVGLIHDEDTDTLKEIVNEVLK